MVVKRPGTPSSGTRLASLRLARSDPSIAIFVMLFARMKASFPAASSHNSLSTDTSPLPVAAGGHARSREFPLRLRKIVIKELD